MNKFIDIVFTAIVGMTTFIIVLVVMSSCQLESKIHFGAEQQPVQNVEKSNGDA